MALAGNTLFLFLFFLGGAGSLYFRTHPGPNGKLESFEGLAFEVVMPTLIPKVASCCRSLVFPSFSPVLLHKCCFLLFVIRFFKLLFVSLVLGMMLCVKTPCPKKERRQKASRHSSWFLLLHLQHSAHPNTQNNTYIYIYTYMQPPPPMDPGFTAFWGWQI